MYKLISILVLGLCCNTALLSADTIELKDISAQGKYKSASITVNGNDDFVTRLARKAFSVHGAFKVIARGKSSFDLNFSKLADGKVQLTIETSTSPYAKIFTAKSTRQAALIAVDHAIGKMTGEPGFFAGKMAFIGENRGVTELWMSDLFFLSATALTSDRSDVMAPAWAPNGKTLLYTTYFKAGFPDIYRMDIEGNRITRKPFASYRGTNTGSAVSPDGSSVAFSVSNRGNSEIYRSDLSGRDVKKITNLKSLEGSPSWSPDGSQLVLLSDQMGPPQLFVMSSRGGPMQRLNTRVSRYYDQPEWNPLFKNLIVFTASIDRVFQVCLYDLDTQETVILTSGTSNSLEPTWASDGRHIIFTRKSGKKSTLYLIDSVTKKTSILSPPKFGNASQASFVYAP